MRNKWQIYSLLLAGMLSLDAVAMTINCPPAIKTKQTLQEGLKNWDAFIDDENEIHQFNRITFYDKSPNQHASLAPDNEGENTNHLIWHFDKQEIWLACGYSNTSIQLIQKLPQTLKKCSVEYESNYTQIKAIDCN